MPLKNQTDRNGSVAKSSMADDFAALPLVIGKNPVSLSVELVKTKLVSYRKDPYE